MYHYKSNGAKYNRSTLLPYMVVKAKIIEDCHSYVRDLFILIPYDAIDLVFVCQLYQYPLSIRKLKGNYLVK